MINNNKNFIYVHIPKTGGISIEKTLGGRIGDHRNIKRYIECLNKNMNLFHQYFSFAFVRNPWDKMVSNYFYDKKGGFSGKSPMFRTNQLEFNEWIKIIHTFGKPKRMYTNQVDWITNFENKIDISFIGRFENLEEDWNTVCKKINIDTKLFHLNKTNRNEDYRIYYKDTEAIEVVAKLHHKDIETFNYKFE